MQELAADIAAKVEGGSGLESDKKAEAAKAQSAGKPAADATLQQLQELTKGLFFVSESEAPLEAVSYEVPSGELTDAVLHKVLVEPVSAKIEKLELAQFLRNHTADDGVLGDVDLANRYKALQMFMKQELSDTRVYRVGSGPQLYAYALGHSAEGKLTGFKTMLTET
ncbi:nuclease A inhibitor family protein [Hymenobacter sp. ASUV-10]|uniref:Nuclease A inhibitor family protein n=2 Tax=Hymenobacter aranciens TaxID=3063996 RepID=A0ABT9BE08_9BACT|nr:nuclease A inhibitor family protein [Hymenobacter sp. ASUV-10]MDO7876487.1 nuclease A inhibitor family protein [Hymenobacter sp. ASUV-10]